METLIVLPAAAFQHGQKKEKRKTEREDWGEWERAGRPVLGCIFLTL